MSIWRTVDADSRALFSEALAQVVDDVGGLGHPRISVRPGDAEHGHGPSSTRRDERIVVRVILVDIAVLDLEVEALQRMADARAIWAAVVLIEREIRRGSRHKDELGPEPENCQ